MRGRAKSSATELELVELARTDAPEAVRVVAESEIHAIARDLADLATWLDGATSRRTEFEPTSMTATRTDGIVATGRSGYPARRSRAPRRARLSDRRIIVSWCECGLPGFAGSDAHPLARRLEHPGVRVVGERAVEDRVDLLANAGVLDRHEHLDAMVEVALHEIRASDVRRDALVGLERVDAAVLEEASDDRADVDVLREPLDAGTERARRAGDDVDLRARPRRCVELVDDLRIDEMVELEPDARVLSLRCGGCDARGSRRRARCAA